MRVVCLLLVLLAVCFAQNDINTGEGLSALLFNGNGGVELSTGPNTPTLSQNLPKSFSFEAWIMLPNPPADGYYKTIVSRYDIGPDQNFNNRWADFVLEVQASGTISFFMGNGGASIYGILISASNLQQSTWYHVGFTVSTSGALNGTRFPNPDYATLYLNNQQYTRAWDTGSRQVPDASRGRNIYLGDYFNQDGDHQWWRGYLDEVRFWSGVRTLDQVTATAQRVVPGTTAGLLAYYRFNDAAGLFLQDSSVNMYDGRLSKATTSSAIPVWTLSGAKIYVDVTVPPGAITSIYLPGVSPTGSLSFTYVIQSLPVSNTSAGIVNGAGRLLADGQFITTTPFALLTNAVSFEAPNTTSEVTFVYYGTYNFLDSSQGEPLPTIVYVNVNGAPCVPDQCGRCNGDGSACTCIQLPYNGYDTDDLERILVLYEIEQAIGLLNNLEYRLESVIRSLSSQQLSDLQQLITQVQQFGQTCLFTFCAGLEPYLPVLASISPQ